MPTDAVHAVSAIEKEQELLAQMLRTGGRTVRNEEQMDDQLEGGYRCQIMSLGLTAGGV